MPDFLQEKQREINARLAELAPLVEEYERLQAADPALATTSAPSRTTPRQSTRAGRGPGRPRGGGSRTAVTAATTPRVKPAPRAGQGRRGRPKGGGKRATQALTYITSRPGITIPELASKMGIKQNYLYTVLPMLEQAGSVTKQGRGWHPRINEAA
jgi:hypothetical protein